MLYIPSEITVGFKKLDESFTGKKGFITYRELGNATDKLFNQSKFDQYLDKTAENLILDNKPTSGFIVNKKMIHDHSYFGQISNILIYHPSGFEFEISLSNLIMIMEHSDINAQEIKQECVLGWYKSFPVLVPTNSEVYTQAVADNSEILEVKDMNKDLVVGRSYYSKTEKNLIYIGKKSILKIKDFTNISDIKTHQGHIFLKDNREFVSLAKCQAAYSSEIHPKIEHFIKMYDFQQAQININPEQIYVKSTPCISYINEFKHSITYNFAYLKQNGSAPKDNQLFSIYFSIIHSLQQKLFSFPIYSALQQEPFSLLLNYTYDTPKNEKAFEFKPCSLQYKAFCKYESPYFKSPISENLPDKLHTQLVNEFKVDEFIAELKRFVVEYYDNNDIDLNILFDIVERFLIKIELVGIQYSNSEDFDNAILHSSNYYISDYSKFALDGLDVIFSNVEDMFLISNSSFLFKKSESKILKKIE